MLPRSELHRLAPKRTQQEFSDLSFADITRLINNEICYANSAKKLSAEFHLRLALEHCAGRTDLQNSLTQNFDLDVVKNIADSLSSEAAPSNVYKCLPNLDDKHLLKRIEQFRRADGSFPVYCEDSQEAFLVPFTIVECGADEQGAVKDVKNNEKGSYQNLIRYFPMLRGTRVELGANISDGEIGGNSFDLAVLLAITVKKSMFEHTVPCWMLCATGECNTGPIEAGEKEQKFLAARSCMQGVFITPANWTAQDSATDWICPVQTAVTDSTLLEELEKILIRKGLLKVRNSHSTTATENGIFPIKLQITNSENAETEGLELDPAELASHISHGKVIALTGSAGSGKSTALECIIEELAKKPLIENDEGIYIRYPVRMGADDIRRLNNASLDDVIKKSAGLESCSFKPEQLVLVLDEFNKLKEEFHGQNVLEKLAQGFQNLLAPGSGPSILFGTRHSDTVTDFGFELHHTAEMLPVAKQSVKQYLSSINKNLSNNQSLVHLCTRPFYLDKVLSTQIDFDEQDNLSAYNLLKNIVSPPYPVQPDESDFERVKLGERLQGILGKQALTSASEKFSLEIQGCLVDDKMKVFAGETEKRHIIKPKPRSYPNWEFSHDIWRDFFWVHHQATEKENLLTALNRSILGSFAESNEIHLGEVQASLAPWHEILAFSVQAIPELLDDVVLALLRVDIRLAAYIELLGRREGEDSSYVRKQIVSKALYFLDTRQHHKTRESAIDALFILKETELFQEIIKGRKSNFLRDFSTRKYMLQRSITDGDWLTGYLITTRSILARKENLAVCQQGKFDENIFVISSGSREENFMRRLFILCEKFKRSAQDPHNQAIQKEKNQNVDQLNRWLGGPAGQGEFRDTTYLKASRLLLASLVVYTYNEKKRHALPFLAWDKLIELMPFSFWSDFISTMMHRPNRELFRFDVLNNPKVSKILKQSILQKCKIYRNSENFGSTLKHAQYIRFLRSLFVYRVKTELPDNPLALWERHFALLFLRAFNNKKGGKHNREFCWILSETPACYPEYYSLEQINNIISPLISEIQNNFHNVAVPNQVLKAKRIIASSFQPDYSSFLENINKSFYVEYIKYSEANPTCTFNQFIYTSIARENLAKWLLFTQITKHNNVFVAEVGKESHEISISWAIKVVTAIPPNYFSPDKYFKQLYDSSRYLLSASLLGLNIFSREIEEELISKAKAYSRILLNYNGQKPRYFYAATYTLAKALKRLQAYEVAKSLNNMVAKSPKTDPLQHYYILQIIEEPFLLFEDEVRNALLDDYNKFCSSINRSHLSFDKYIQNNGPSSRARQYLSEWLLFVQETGRFTRLHIHVDGKDYNYSIRMVIQIVLALPYAKNQKNYSDVIKEASNHLFNCLSLGIESFDDHIQNLLRTCAREIKGRLVLDVDSAISNRKIDAKAYRTLGKVLLAMGDYKGQFDLRNVLLRRDQNSRAQARYMLVDALVHQRIFPVSETTDFLPNEEEFYPNIRLGLVADAFSRTGALSGKYFDQNQCNRFLSEFSHIYIDSLKNLQEQDLELWRIRLEVLLRTKDYAGILHLYGFNDGLRKWDEWKRGNEPYKILHLLQRLLDLKRIDLAVKVTTSLVYPEPAELFEETSKMLFEPLFAILGHAAYDLDNANARELAEQCSCAPDLPERFLPSVLEHIILPKGSVVAVDWLNQKECRDYATDILFVMAKAAREIESQSGRRHLVAETNKLISNIDENNQHYFSMRYDLISKWFEGGYSESLKIVSEIIDNTKNRNTRNNWEECLCDGVLILIQQSNSNFESESISDFLDQIKLNRSKIYRVIAETVVRKGESNDSCIMLLKYLLASMCDDKYASVRIFAANMALASPDADFTSLASYLDTLE